MSDGMVKILVVEDEPLLLRMAVDVVEDAGFEVIAAHEADEAIVLLEFIPDVTILWTDIDMPGSMDGLTLAAAVCDRRPPVQILIVSGMKRPTSSEIPQRGVFFPKPYDARLVTETLVRIAAPSSIRLAGRSRRQVISHRWRLRPGSAMERLRRKNVVSTVFALVTERSDTCRLRASTLKVHRAPDDTFAVYQFNLLGEADLSASLCAS